ncbi:hypothetical protein WMF02_002113 [Acinetobacter baumannii]
MTVSASDRISQLYVGNGTNTDFDFTFRVFKQEDESGISVRVKTGDAFEPIDPALYVVEINQDDLGGRIVFNTPPDSSTFFYIAGTTAVDQQLDITNYDNFYPEALERALDKLTAILQEWRHFLDAETMARILADIRYDELAKVRENDLKIYLLDEIRKQGLALDQIDQHFQDLIERLNDIAVDKGWDSSFVTHNGKTQYEINETNTRGIKNISDLRKFKGTRNNQRAETLEYSTNSGYGGAIYKWDSASNEIDDGFSVIAVDGISTGRWKIVLINRTLKATQAGLVCDLFSTDKINQSDIVQKCIDYMAKIGGGTVQLPTGHIYAKVVAKSNVHLKGSLSPYITSATDISMSATRSIVNDVKVAHGTFLHSIGSIDTIYIGENIDNTKVSDLEVSALRFDGGLCGFGIRVAGRNTVIDTVKGEGFRFEPLYLRGKDDPSNIGGTCVNTKILNCEFGNSSRNSFAAIYCNDVYIKNCNFYQTDTSIAWVYLWDIEPNPSTSDTVYNVIVDNCTFNAVSRAGAEPTVLVKEQNTPTGSPNVKFLNCKFKGAATIRNNCAAGWRDCVIDNCEFEGRAFSTTSGYTILTGRFTNNKMLGVSSTQFAFNTIFTGDFVIEQNTFNNINFTGVNLNNPSFGVNYFLGTGTVVAAIDRRSITSQYRQPLTALEIFNTPSSPLIAISRTEVRQVNLTTSLVDILTAHVRSGVEITITGCDANDGIGSKAFVKLFINTDDTTSVTAAQEIINPATYGVSFAWNGRTLQLATKSTAANQFIVKVEVTAALPQYKGVTWLVT